MYRRIAQLLFVSLTFVASLRAQTVIDLKGTRIVVDTSKWTLNGTNIYNKNPGSVGIGTEGVANANAALEVSASDKGILIPRIALTSLSAAAPLTAHLAGMMVYNTATAGSAPNNVSPGFYYNNGTAWIKVADAAELGKADNTKDAWVDDPTNTQVKLGTKSNGTTARDAGTDVVIKDNGRVGIGTSSPVATLHVKNGDFRLENNDNWNAYKGVTYSDNKYPQLFLFQARGTKAAPTYPQSGTTMGVFRSANAIDSAGGAGFRVRSTEQQSATAHGSSVIIYTTLNGQGDNIDRFIVDHNGNVGIADNIRFITPKSRLYLEGYARLGTADATADALTAAADRAGMVRYNSTSKTLQYHNDTQWVTAASAATADLTKDAWVDDNANTQVKLGKKSDGTTDRDPGTEVVIKDNGRTGIGTSTPQKTLHVNGAAQVTGELSVGGDATTPGNAGTTGQVLTSNGPGATPTWTTINPSVANITKVTSAYTVSATDYTVLADATTAGFTITLPSAAANTGRFLVIRKTDETSNALTFSSAIKISETTSFTTLNVNVTIRMQSDGTNWYKID